MKKLTLILASCFSPEETAAVKENIETNPFDGVYKRKPFNMLKEFCRYCLHSILKKENLDK